MRGVSLRFGFAGLTLAATVTGLASGDLAAQTPNGRARARDLGVAPGIFKTGANNAITDVSGVLVGQTTVTDGDSVHTGITAIRAHGGNQYLDRVPAAVHVGNAFGKLVGSTQVKELGELETPILLTCTLCVWKAADAMVEWMIAQPGMERVGSLNPVVGETNDGGLNAIRSRPIRPEHVRAALDGAKSGPVAEGSVGAGAGTQAFGWKGGIGTSSRTVKQGTDTWTVGVLVQSNYGGKLVIDGVPVWKELAPARGRGAGAADGSCMIVVATDAPLDAKNLQRLAARAIFALARTGSTYSNGSGDFAIAFSTHPSQRVTGAAGPQARTAIPTDGVSGLFEAVLDATEEAVDNSLLKATDVTSGNRTIQAIPIDPLRALLKKYGRGVQ